MSNRSSKRRSSTSSFSFSSRPRNKATVSRKAQNENDDRTAARESERQNIAKRQRDNATIKIYDDAAKQTIDDDAFLKLSIGEQNLLIYKETRANKLVAIKTRRVQHKQSSEPVIELKITEIMRADIEKFVCDYFFGLIPRSDARKNFTTFPMAFWKLIRKALFDYYLKLSKPIACKWAQDTAAAEIEAKAAFKRIRARLYGLLEAWVNGKNGTNSIEKICSKINMQLQKATKLDGEEAYSRLSVYTQFELLLVEKCGIETDLIRVATEYGTNDTSGAVTCLGDFVENYMLFKKREGWKASCKRCIRNIEAFFVRMAEDSAQLSLPSTQLEFTPAPSQDDGNLSLSLDDWLADQEDVEINCDAPPNLNPKGIEKSEEKSASEGKKSSRTKQPKTIFISDSESEDLLPSEFVRKRTLASSPDTDQKTQSEKTPKSAYRGVTFDKRSNKWIGKIWRSTEWSTVGYFKTDIEAAEAINRRCVLFRLPQQNKISVNQEPASSEENRTKRKSVSASEEKPRKKPKITDFPKKKRRLSVDLFSLPLTPPPLENLTPDV